jgi:hypothetical protein
MFNDTNKKYTSTGVPQNLHVGKLKKTKDTELHKMAERKCENCSEGSCYPGFEAVRFNRILSQSFRQVTQFIPEQTAPLPRRYLRRERISEIRVDLQFTDHDTTPFWGGGTWRIWHGAGGQQLAVTGTTGLMLVYSS